MYAYIFHQSRASVRGTCRDDDGGDDPPGPVYKDSQYGRQVKVEQEGTSIFQWKMALKMVRWSRRVCGRVASLAKYSNRIIISLCTPQFTGRIRTRNERNVCV